MGFADLHIHSVYSWDGTSTVPAIIKYAADRTKLNVIAITDHDEIDGSLEALQLAPAYGVEVIPGCEISTSEGHLLAYYIHKKIPADLSLMDTLRLIGEQGGIAVAAHPEAFGMKSLPFSAIRNALLYPETRQILVGVESFNSGIFYRKTNFLAGQFCRANPVAEVGNSDSHILNTIGDGMTRFPGSTVNDLRWALENRKTKALTGERVTTGIGIVGRWLPLFLLRSAGLAVWNVAPQAPIRLIRAERNTTA